MAARRSNALRSDYFDATTASWPLQREEVSARKSDRRVPLVLVQGLALLLFAAVAWRAPPAQAAVLGMVALFSLTSSATYYWSLLLLAPIAMRAPLVAALLLASLALYVLHPYQGDKLVRYGLLSWGLASLFAVWLVSEWRRPRPLEASSQPEAGSGP